MEGDAPPAATESVGEDLGVVGDDAGLVLQHSVVAMGARYNIQGVATHSKTNRVAKHTKKEGRVWLLLTTTVIR